MKNNKIYLLGACLLCAVTVFAQNVSLQPPPQQLIVQNKTIDLPAVYQLNGGEEANPHAVKVLKELLSGGETQSVLCENQQYADVSPQSVYILIGR